MSRKRKDSPPAFWIFGVHPIEEALNRRDVQILELVYSRGNPRLERLAEAARRRSIPIRLEDRHALNALLGTTHHQGVAARTEQYAYTSLDDFLRAGPTSIDPIVILDCIQDPQNLGSIMRSACFLGARGVILPRDRSARVTGTVIKVAAGATAYLPVVQVTNLVRAMERLKALGIWIVGLDLETDRSLYEVDFRPPSALVVGNEQKGLRPLVRKGCDLLARIPASGPLQSLNAGNAAAVALSEIQRQRHVRQIRSSSPAPRK